MSIKPPLATLRTKTRRLTDHPFIRRVAVLAGGTALGQIIVAASSPIVTRLYSPEALGLLAVFVALLVPLLSLASLRYEVAIVLPKSDRTAMHLMYVSGCVIIAFSLLLALVGGMWRDEIADAFNVPELATYFWLLPVSVLAGGFFQTLSYWGVRTKAFAAIGQAKLTQSVASVVVQIVSGLLSLTPVGLLLGDAVSRAMGSSRLARNAWGMRARTGAPSWTEMRQAANRYRKFPLYSLGPAVVNSVNLQLPALILSFQFGAAPAGFFALSQRILGSPLNLVSSAVGQVLLGDAAEVARATPHTLMRRCTRTAGILGVVGLAVVVPVAIVAPPLFGTLFGSEWGTAGEYLQVLAPFFIAQFVSAPLGVILDVLERQDLHVVREIVRGALMLGGWWIAGQTVDTSLALVGVLSIAGTLGYAFGIVLVWRALTAIDQSASSNSTGQDA